MTTHINADPETSETIRVLRVPKETFSCLSPDEGQSNVEPEPISMKRIGLKRDGIPLSENDITKNLDPFLGLIKDCSSDDAGTMKKQKCIEYEGAAFIKSAFETTADISYLQEPPQVHITIKFRSDQQIISRTKFQKFSRKLDRQWNSVKRSLNDGGRWTHADNHASVVIEKVNCWSSKFARRAFEAPSDVLSAELSQPLFEISEDLPDTRPCQPPEAPLTQGQRPQPQSLDAGGADAAAANLHVAAGKSEPVKRPVHDLHRGNICATAHAYNAEVDRHYSDPAATSGLPVSLKLDLKEDDSERVYRQSSNAISTEPPLDARDVGCVQLETNGVDPRSLRPREVGNMLRSLLGREDVYIIPKEHSLRVEYRSEEEKEKLLSIDNLLHAGVIPSLVETPRGNEIKYIVDIKVQSLQMDEIRKEVGCKSARQVYKWIEGRKSLTGDVLLEYGRGKAPSSAWIDYLELKLSDRPLYCYTCRRCGHYTDGCDVNPRFQQ